MKDNTFPIRLEIIQRYPVSQFLFNIILKVLDSGIRDRRPLGFPDSSDSKESDRNAGDLGSISGLGRFPGEGNGNPLQCSCVENSRDRGAWWAPVHRVAVNGKQLSD